MGLHLIDSLIGYNPENPDGPYKIVYVHKLKNKAITCSTIFNTCTVTSKRKNAANKGRKEVRKKYKMQNLDTVTQKIYSRPLKLCNK